MSGSSPRTWPFESEPEAFWSTARRVTLRCTGGSGEVSTQLVHIDQDNRWTGLAARTITLAPAKETDLPQSLEDRSGLSIHVLNVHQAGNDFRFPLVLYRENVQDTLDRCRYILDRLPSPSPPLRADVDRLQAVADSIKSVATDSEHAAWRALYRQSRELQSRCMLANLPSLPPIACFGRYEFDGPFGIGTYMCWNIVNRWGCCVRTFNCADAGGPSDKVIFEDPHGTIFDMNVSYDAKTLFLAYKHQANGDSYHLYEIPAAGGSLKQLTSGRYHDVHPVLLPSGRLLFASTHGESFSMCQPGAASAMFVMDRDGGNIHRISMDTLGDHSPQMLPDGRVVFTRWEYIDHGLYWRQGLWTIGPDGTRVELLAGNTKGDPNTFWQARAIPGTSRLLATFVPHHNTPVGAIGEISPRRGLEAHKDDGFAWITREFPSIGDTCYRWSYCDPFPLSESLFLVSYGGSNAGRFRIFLMDDRGDKECIFSDPKISLHYPLPLREQVPPPALAPPTAATGVTTGTFILTDVYRGLSEAMRGKVKTIQIMQQVPKRCNMQGQRAWDMDPLVGRGTYYVKRVIGEVPVEADGSAYFQAPAMREIYFQALDADGREPPADGLGDPAHPRRGAVVSGLPRRPRAGALQR